MLCIIQDINPNDCVITHVTEWEMPPSDWTWDPKAEGVGWGAQPGDEGVEGKTEAQEEGIFHIS